MLPGKIATLLIIATVLSFFGALIVAARYRAAMKALMKAPLDIQPGPESAPHKPLPYCADAPPATVSLADNRQAEKRLILVFLGIALIMSLSRTLLMQRGSRPLEKNSRKRPPPGLSAPIQVVRRSPFGSVLWPGPPRRHGARLSPA